MTVTVADVEAMVSGAIKRVRQGWMPPRSGSPLSTQLSDAMPALTTGVVDRYLEFSAWLWERFTPQEEAEQVLGRIESDAATAWVRSDFRIRNGVLAVCALWAAIGERTQQEQEEIRAILRQARAPGTYPELEPEPVESAPQSVEQAMAEDAARHRAVMDALRTQFLNPPSI